MQFEDTFFEDEIREGFFVPGIMKRAWAAQLEILEAIDRICRKYRIQYFAQWGTLLGAVRHHGFIPWDDDLDIAMKRPDYNRFLEIAPQEFTGEYNYLHFSKDEEFGDFMIRVLNTRKIHLEDDFLDEFHQFPFVAGVDIFPWDYITKEEEKDKEQQKLIVIVNSLAEAIRNGTGTSELRQNIREVEKLCNVRFDRTKSMICQLKVLADRLCGMYSAEDAEEITLMPLRANGGTYKLPKEYLDAFVDMPFENTTIPVPLEYDEILKKSYADYMTPIRGWDSHDYPFYEGMEEYLERLCGEVPYEYRIPQGKDLAEQRSRRSRQPDTGRQQAEELLSLMRQAQKEAAHLAAENNAEAAGQILIECQSAAISVGTLLEKSLAGKQRNEKLLELVKELESYCEEVYQWHCGLQADPRQEKDAYAKKLEDRVRIMEEKLPACFESEEIREIVFIVSHPQYWNAYDALWRAAGKDTRNHVTVLCVPYYNRTFKRKLLDCTCSTEGIPEAVTLTDWESYAFEKTMPDVIYIQDPYDEYNCSKSVHPRFFASNLRKYTDKLVCVPVMIPDDFEIQDARAVRMMQYYIQTPGIVLADEVLVPSKAMQTIYIEILTKGAGEESHSMWKQVVRVQAWERPEEEPEELPEEWNRLIRCACDKRRKVILYNVGLSQLLHEREKMLEKMQYVWSILQRYKDEILFLWYNEKQVMEVLQRKNPELWNAYEQLLQRFEKEQIGILDLSGEEKRAVRVADAFYGDSGRMMNLFRAAKKPVMCQNVELIPEETV